MELWSDYEGKTLDGRFPLEQLIGPSGRSAAFLTRDAAGEPAVIRVVETLNYEEEEILARWRTVESLKVDNLLGMREMGKTEMGGTHLVYAVLEPTDADLEEALHERALTPEETKQIGTSLVRALRALHGAGLVHEHVEASYVLGAGDVVKLRSDCVREMPEGMEAGTARARDVRDLALLLHRALTLRKEVGETGPALPPPFNAVVRDAMDGVWGLEEIGVALEDRAPEPVTPPRPDAAWKLPAARVYTTDAVSGPAPGPLSGPTSGPLSGPVPGPASRPASEPAQVRSAPAVAVSRSGVEAAAALDRAKPAPADLFRETVPRVVATRSGERESLELGDGTAAQVRSGDGAGLGVGIGHGAGAGAEVWPGGEGRSVRRSPLVPRLIGTVEAPPASSGDAEAASPGVGDRASEREKTHDRPGVPATEGDALGASPEPGLGAFARRGEYGGGGRPVAPDRIVVEPERVDRGTRRRLLLGGAGVAAVALAAFGVHAWRSEPKATPAAIPVASSATRPPAVTSPASRGGTGVLGDGTGIPAEVPPAPQEESAPAAVSQPVPTRRTSAIAAGAMADRRRSGTASGAASRNASAPPAGKGEWRVVAYTFRREDQAEHKARQIAERHGALRPQIFSPTGRAPYLVALGGWMSVEQAMALREKARREGLPRDLYMQNYKRARGR